MLLSQFSKKQFMVLIIFSVSCKFLILPLLWQFIFYDATFVGSVGILNNRVFFFFIYEIGNKNAYLLHSAVVRTKWCKGYKNSSEGSRVLQERSTIIVIIELCRQKSCSASVPSIKLNPGQSAGRADMVVGCVCVWVQAAWFWVVHYISSSNPLMA